MSAPEGPEAYQPHLEVVRDHYQEALERGGSTLAARLEAVAECEQSLATLVEVRTRRPWTGFEYDSYLRLRRSRATLQQSARRAQRTFDFACEGLRERHAVPPRPGPRDAA